jgi:hypothetical protein
MRLIARASCELAVLALTAACGAVALTAGPAASDGPCGGEEWATAKDSGDGHPNDNNTPIRSGPASTCRVLDIIDTTAHLKYDCALYGSGRTWEHVHLYGYPTIYNGWVNAAKLRNLTVVTCPIE